MGVMHDRLLKLVKKGVDLTPRQLVVLFECEAEPRSVRFLAERMEIAKPAVTRAVDRLVASGFAERIDEPGDRRSILVKLLPNGRKFARAADPD